MTRSYAEAEPGNMREFEKKTWPYIEAWARHTTKNPAITEAVITLRYRAAREDGAPTDTLFKQGDQWVTLWDLYEDDPSLTEIFLAKAKFACVPPDDSEGLAYVSLNDEDGIPVAITSKRDTSWYTKWGGGYFDGPDFVEHLKLLKRRWPNHVLLQVVATAEPSISAKLERDSS